ncbi:methyltransferase domain-containing protein [Serratia sp. 3ACOL1]|uniref:methyltransferase domain-containing protein n=1 Tax=Serratia sp. 3ACOL1 TaxID=2448483 RepID=UPI000EF45D03|nr:methyltransferase domain-containing protein [Serratia sp. 3ACOL1]AYM89689.1 methyltransferase domain-containing protein [Serratia sp. 3ACOL1]
MINIEKYVASLPECYQLIYGHPELEIVTSRNCSDRLVIVENVVKKLHDKLQRPLKLLDLGCAQGFFSLSLAKYCSKVMGVDFLDKNIELCNALTEEFSIDHVEFYQGTVQSVIQSIDFAEYDIVLGFSIFHHVCHSDGYLSAKEQINLLANKAGVLLLELAVKEEGLYWAEQLPEHADDILDDIAFSRALGEFGTHLTDVTRPLYFSSSKYWFVENEIEPINDWSKESHEFAYSIHQGSRRYYWSDDKFLKVYSFTGELAAINKKDIEDEVKSLRALSQCNLSSIKLPHLYYYGEENNSGFLIYDLISGVRLSQLISQSKSYNSLNVCRSVLGQLCELESHGYYHNDVRVWNVLIGDESSSLIDFSSIGKNQSDVVWPYNIFLSFIIFVNEVERQKEPVLLPNRSPLFLLNWPKCIELRLWLASIWAVPADEWSFAKFKVLLDQVIDSECDSNKRCAPPIIHSVNIALWLSANEALFKETVAVRDYLDTAQSVARLYFSAPDHQREPEDTELIHIIKQQEAVHQQLLNQLAAEDDIKKKLVADNLQLTQEISALKELIVKIHLSTSWLITKPLRLMKRLITK